MRLLLISLFSLSLVAQKTDKGSYPVPSPPTLPAANNTFVDPTFGTTILRLTDATWDATGCGVEYSYWGILNTNSTRGFVECSGTRWFFVFDPTTKRVTNKTNADSLASYFWGANIWSATNPDVIYSHEFGTKIYSINAGTQVATEYMDVQADIGGTGRYIRQFHRSADDNRFSYTINNSGYTVDGYGVSQKSPRTAVYVNTSTPTLDECHIDKSGNWLRQGLEDGTWSVRNLTTLVSENLTVGAPDYAASHEDVGTGTVVNGDYSNVRTLIRNWATPHAYTVILNSLVLSHVSYLSRDESWVTISHAFDVGQEHNSNAFADEIYQIATDGSERVRRWAHHQSDVQGYGDYPFAQVSADGKFIVFSSNWQSSGRTDIFIILTESSTPQNPSSPSATTAICKQ